MRRSKIKAKLHTGDPVLVTHLGLADASIFELASMMGFDGLWLDLEHHGFSMETAHHLFRAARVGSSDIIARPAKGEFMRMGRLLEAGAQGIMYPRCESAEEAAEVIRWAKFPPLGTRGLDGGNPDAPYCTNPTAQYIQQANEQTFIIIQIEDNAGVDAAGAIAGIEGVDVLFLGPNDFAALSGVPGELDHPIVKRALKRIAEAANRAGKAWGTIAFNPDHARELLDMGATFLAHGADIVMLKQAFDRIQADFAPLGFGFDGTIARPAKAAPVRVMAP